MAKFKEGDKVIIVKNVGGPTTYTLGETVSVVCVHEYGAYLPEVQEYTIKGDNNETETWREDELEHVPEEITVLDSASNEIKIGFVPKEHFDEVNKAAHYNQGKYEVIEVLKDWLSPEEYKGFLRGNVLKYVARYQQKGGAKDLQKAEYYNKKLMEVVGEK